MKPLIQEEKGLMPGQSSFELYLNKHEPVDDLRHDMVMNFGIHLMENIQYTLLVSRAISNSRRQSKNHPCSTIQFYRSYHIGGTCSRENIIHIDSSEITLY